MFMAICVYENEHKVYEKLKFLHFMTYSAYLSGNKNVN